MTEERANLLAVVFDVNPTWWGQQTMKQPNMSFTKCLDSLLVFCSSHLLLSPLNKLCLIAAHSNENRFIYPKKNSTETDCPSTSSSFSSSSAGKYEKFSLLEETARNEIKDMILNDKNPKLHTDCVLTGAMSMALCYINRITKEQPPKCPLISRILVVKGSVDNNNQYMNMMSVVFTAQKMGVVIDACILGNDSNLLKQATDLLDGIYLKIPQISCLLQYLLYLYLPSPSLRNHLTFPPKNSIGHKAACFCHRNSIDIGFICSVCLSIFCTFSPICPTCQSAFKMNVPHKPMKKKTKK